jgi:hypothetical protein
MIFSCDLFFHGDVDMCVQTLVGPQRIYGHVRTRTALQLSTEPKRVLQGNWTIRFWFSVILNIKSEGRREVSNVRVKACWSMMLHMDLVVYVAVVSFRNCPFGKRNSRPFVALFKVPKAYHWILSSAIWIQPTSSSHISLRYILILYDLRFSQRWLWRLL